MMFPEVVFSGVVVGVVAQCDAQPAQFVNVPIPLVHDLCAVHIRLCDLLFSNVDCVIFYLVMAMTFRVYRKQNWSCTWKDCWGGGTGEGGSQKEEDRI